MHLESKKAGGYEIPYLLFFVVFFATLTIGASIFTKPLFEKMAIEDKSGITEQINNFIFSSIKDIPYIGEFISLVMTSIILVSVHPYVGTLVGALIGVPLAYIIIKVLRGGG